ncbi:MAG TPA: cyclic nucleotide-binding domain-containing protein [Panacibacter sp.]|nr:cyclic nucleotide-binding domain-containing protein [Panacibacter sp.]
MEKSIAQLQKFTYSILKLEENEWNDFSSIWLPLSAKRKTLLTAAGETEKHLYFITEGVQRAFYLHNDKEATLVFTYPYSFSGVADSFLTQLPSRYYFETLTASTFLRTTYQQVHKLMNQHRNIAKLILKATSFALSGVLERQIELQCFSAEEKFRTLLKRSPHVLQLIPHKYLASYLGIDATTFSKLLGTIRL